MMLYPLRDWQLALLTPFRMAAEVTERTFRNPFLPAAYTEMGRAIAASAELFERSTRAFEKPGFNLTRTTLRGIDIDVEEEVSAVKPFCRLLHFRRSSGDAQLSERMGRDPRVLLVAPLSGHFSTLLRGTVEALLPEHDVYITDWIDAKQVPLSHGKFDLEDMISLIMDFTRRLGPDVNLVGVCQSAVPVLCAVSMLATLDDPAQPRTMTLMGGPIDTACAKTPVSSFAESHSIEWFQQNALETIPFYYPGAYRLVYPGFLQLQSFISMNVERHMDEHVKLFQDLVRGNEEAADVNRAFYNEYLSVMDVPAEFYLETVERVFQKHELSQGRFRWHNQLVRPEDIKKTALLTVEGELDDISAPGQTFAAHALCAGLPSQKKKAHFEIGVGHFGIFSGRKWRNNIEPALHAFIRQHSGQPAEEIPSLGDAPNL